VLKLAFTFFALFGLAFLAFGLWRTWTAFQFERESTIRPGVFTNYQTILREERRGAGLPGTQTGSELRAVFEVELEDGSMREITGSEIEVVRNLDAGDEIEVLVHPDPQRTPRIRAFISLYGSALSLVVVGAIFFALPVYGMHAAQRWSQSSGGAYEAGASGLADSYRAGSGDVSSGLTMLGGSLLFAAAVLGAYWFLARSGSLDELARALRSLDSAPAADERPPERAVAREQSRAGGKVVSLAERRASAQPRVRPAAVAVPPPRPKHRSAAHAARAGDHEALLEYIRAGEDIADINPANLVGPISRGQVDALRVLFERGYPHHWYAGRTLGDHALQHRQPAVMRLVQEFDGPFAAPSEFVALALGDEAALRAALAEAQPGTLFNGRNLEWWAREYGHERLLQEARSDEGAP